MLLLHRARFRNFRLLRDIEIDFSTDPERPLTVIRAENESGKTTLHTALQWVFYGESALPQPTATDRFRLHPIDWDTQEEGTLVEVMGEVTFTSTSSATTPSGGVRETTREYVLRRSASETIRDKSFERVQGGVTLLERVGNAGYEPVETNPEVVIAELLPLELREILFLDGDRALAFIEASADTKRARVEGAIRGLLGVELVEEAQRHVTHSLSGTRRRLRDTDDRELADLSERLADLEEEEARFHEEARDHSEAVQRSSEEAERYERALHKALEKGDREALSRELGATRRALDDAQQLVQGATRNVSAMLDDPQLALSLARSAIVRANEHLTPLHEQGRIPSSFIPLLRERLKTGVCICGAPLHEGSDGRATLQSHLREQEGNDELIDRLGELFYRGRTFLNDTTRTPHSWSNQLRERSDASERAETVLKRNQERARELEHQVAGLSDSDVTVLRTQLREARDAHDLHAREQARLETQARATHVQVEEVSGRRQKLLQSRDRHRRQRATEVASEDILNVLRDTLNVLRGETLEEVSAVMNRFFLRMIVADPDQHAIIRQAHVTSEYDIVVLGSHDRVLDPDVDLNGASRRALTVAFILALTKVSSVRAPNIIDTPLGMTSGEVKRQIVETIVAESSQPILFLTRSEINGVGEVLSAAAGMQCTLSNTAHYPTQLVNEYASGHREVVRCSCNHREFCGICERAGDRDQGLTKRPGG